MPPIPPTSACSSGSRSPKPRATSSVKPYAAAGIPLPTNRLPLDTRFFDTPVVRVIPESVKGGVDLRIELRSQARYELQQASGLITIAFQRS